MGNRGEVPSDTRSQRRPAAGSGSSGTGWQAVLDAERIRIARRILPIIIGIAAPMGLVFLALYFVLGRPWQWLGMVAEVAWATLFFLFAYLAARKGHLTPTVYLTTLGILATTIVGPALIEGIAVAGVMAGVVAIVFARLLAGRAQNNIVVIVSALGIGAGLLLSGFRVFELLATPVWISTALNVTVADIAIVVIGLILDSRDARYEDALAQAEAYAKQVEAQRADLEERSSELARRSRYLEATSAIARDAAALLDLETLLSRVVRLVSERFGLYHTGLFLLDAEGAWVVLHAASSEGGQRMLARGHRLKLGQGIVGYAAEKGEPRIALDVGQDAVFFDNPDLPNTRSEMALPLRVRGEIIGVLDVQSVEPAAFSDEDVAVLQTLADQVALAINNARLFQQAQDSLEAERRAYGELSRQAWAEIMRTRPRLAYRYRKGKVGQVVKEERGERGEERAEREKEAAAAQLPALTLPVEIRGQTLGTITARKPADGGLWTSGERALMETLAEQLSLALDSARLFQETQRRAAREQLVGEVTARMRETLEMEKVLKTAVDEIGRALGLAALDLRLGGVAALGREETQGATDG